MPQWVLLLILFLLLGCGGKIGQTPSAPEPIGQAIDTLSKECEYIYQGDKKTAMAKCLATRIPPEFQRRGYPHMDLVNLFFAHFMEIVQALELNKISESEARTRLAEVEVRIRTEEQRRNALNAQAHAMGAQAESQRRANALLLFQLLQPRKPITCYGAGITTTCY